MPEDEFPFFQDTEFVGDDFEDPDRHPTQPQNPGFSQSLFLDIRLTLGESAIRRPKRL
jgi:hypothetical protein